VTIKLQTKENEDIQLTVFEFHTICSPLPRTVNIHQYPSLQNSELADCLATSETVSNHIHQLWTLCEMSQPAEGTLTEGTLNVQRI